MDWLRASGDGFRLRVWLQPRASANEIVGVHDGYLKVKLTSPPVDNRANRDLCFFIAKKLGLGSATVKILTGSTGRRKVLEVMDEALSESEILKKLGL